MSDDSPSRPMWAVIPLVLRELGVKRVANLALYRLGLRSGHYRREVSARMAARLAEGVRRSEFTRLWNLPLPDDLRAILGPAGVEQILDEADEIVAGQVRLFGAQAIPLRLTYPGPLQHWTLYESGAPRSGARHETDGLEVVAGVAAADIKVVWEPARFGWVYTLGRAYLLTGDERYPQVFWERVETFLDANPPYLGPHWASAQEASLRLIAFCFALQIFQASPHSHSARVLRLLRSIAEHAGRIPPTLVYSRAQDNNHLLSEAAGLATAGALLPHHPCAPGWLRRGWREFQHGIGSQIAPDGSYSQHSANYHRLMLQLAVWMESLSSLTGVAFDASARRSLAAATNWLLALLDPFSGCVPNLGPNDGAYIFPFSVLPFADYRPLLQAAGSLFLDKAPFPPGLWDEMPAWFAPAKKNQPLPISQDGASGLRSGTPHVLQSPDGCSWAYLRAAHFSGRPGHADQLHLDLWHCGLNIAQDAGTYAYNSPPPWDNALAGSEIHNTVTVDGLDQMHRAGRFLFIDWAQAEIIPRQEQTEPETGWLVARHDGYRRLGLIHQRAVRVAGNGWEIVDTLAGSGWTRRLPGNLAASFTLVLHWLLPDWPWQVIEHRDERMVELALQSPLGGMSLSIRAESAAGKQGVAALFDDGFQLARAGELIYGAGQVAPVWGWTSPTYGVKNPALSARRIVKASAETRFISRFSLPGSSCTSS